MRLTAVFSLLVPLTLVGCATHEAPQLLPGTITNASGVTMQVEEGKDAKAKKVKTAPELISQTSLAAFKDEGIVYFDDNRGSRMRVMKQDKSGRWLLEEEYGEGVPHGFTWGTGAAHLLKDGKRVPLGSPKWLVEEKDGTVSLMWDKQPMKLNLTVTAWDVAGLPMKPFLRTRYGTPTKASYFAGDARFPHGSVAYVAELRTFEDAVIVPSTRAFTGSDTIASFIKRFNDKTPYCLRYVPGKDRTPLGFRFDSAKNAKSGEATLYEVKKGTIFCGRANEEEYETADWRVEDVNGTKTLVLKFPRKVATENYGIPDSMKDALSVAFAEEKTVTKKGRRTQTKTRVVPARVWHADEPITDLQYRFNGPAAKALQDLFDASQERRAAWEAKSRQASAAAQQKAKAAQK